MYNSPKLLGISGYSNSGKTTLLEKLLPYLQKYDLRIGVIKHTHHDASTDIPGKDSWRMKEAGAVQVALVSDKRWAIMSETPTAPITLAELTKQFDPSLNDILLVEGFKDEPIPKILLHRQEMARPLPDIDTFTIAIATNYPISCNVPVLDINNPEQIARFIKDWWTKQ